MRRSREATAASKARIVTAAATMLRERGIDGTSIADVMDAAGMTHGGFYKHFGSKDEMTVVAVRAAFDEHAHRFDEREREGGAEAAVRAYVDDYLSDPHIKNPGRGCPVAAIGAEAARHPEALAPEFAAGAEALIERLSRPAAQGHDNEQVRADAIRTLALLVGAVVVTRAVGPGALLDEIRAACARDRPSLADRVQD